MAGRPLQSDKHAQFQAYSKEYKPSKKEALAIAKRLKRMKLISTIEEDRYSIKFLIRCDDDFQEDSYMVRDYIRSKFECLGYTVDIMGTYWLKVTFVNVKQRIDDCFEGACLNE